MITLIERRGALPLAPPLRAYFSTDRVACADLIGEFIGGRQKTLYPSLVSEMLLRSSPTAVSDMSI